MSDILCKHGWSRRFCEPCSAAAFIASFKGPGDEGMLAMQQELTALRAEVERLEEDKQAIRYCNDTQAGVIDALRAENERLRAALESVMIGGNSLAQIIGADHPPHGTTYSEALAYYGSGVKYEAWCCWNTIMLARAALGDTHE